MTDKFVVHVQPNGGYLPFDSQVIEGLNDTVEYVQDFHEGALSDLKPSGDEYWIWELENSTHATIEKFDPAEHSELLLQEQPISP